MMCRLEMQAGLAHSGRRKSQRADQRWAVVLTRVETVVKSEFAGFVGNDSPLLLPLPSGERLLSPGAPGAGVRGSPQAPAATPSLDPLSTHAISRTTSLHDHAELVQAAPIAQMSTLESPVESSRKMPWDSSPITSTTRWACMPSTHWWRRMSSGSRRASMRPSRS